MVRFMVLIKHFGGIYRKGRPLAIVLKLPNPCYRWITMA